MAVADERVITSRLGGFGFLLQLADADRLSDDHGQKDDEKDPGGGAGKSDDPVLVEAARPEVEETRTTFAESALNLRT